MSAMRPASASGAGISASARSTANAMTITLATVPTPGRCRSGTHSSRTATPVIAVIVPKLSGVRSDRPSCSTSHGFSPRAARSCMAMLAP